MAKSKDPLLAALEAGESYSWTVPEGGDLASMRKAIKHGQTLTMSPVADLSQIQVGDMVLVKWYQSDIFHIVGEIQGDRFLIVNSLGKVNGWVSGEAILGRITQVVEPEPPPQVPEMLDQLQAAYHSLVQSENASQQDAARLFAIVDDLRWYADRIGAERLDSMPRSNQWSFAQNLWKLTRQVKDSSSPIPDRIQSFIDRGKRCVGLAAEIAAFFEKTEQ